MAGDLGLADPPSEYFVATGGDDWNTGAIDQPFGTIRRALDAAKPGDTITLRNGVYEGGLNIDVDDLTIRSMPGEWAVIESPLTSWDDGHANSVIRYGFDVEGGRLENVEIVGGYWYGVMFWDWWEPTWEDGAKHVGASQITLDGVKVHDTGVDAIKITPGANDITIINSEVYNTGRRSAVSADGIDNNNGDRMIARGNYIHDVPGVGILTSGGTEDTLIEQNLVRDTGGAGIVVGFYSELEWMEPGENPEFHASRNTTARNNIVVNAGQAGIGVYGSLNPRIYNNTLVDTSLEAQAPIQFGGYDMWVSDSLPYHHAASVNPFVVNNVITVGSTNDTRMIDIREASIVGDLTLDYNLYHSSSTQGIRFIDRNLSGDGTPERTFSQWQADYGYDQHSMLADPQLGADWHLTADSPAIGRAFALADLLTDFDGNPRLIDPPEPDSPAADPPQPDLGADEFSAGANLATPPATRGAPSLEIAERAYHDYESHTIQVKVRRHGSSADTVTVNYTTLDGTAVSGQDYRPVNGTLVFAPGEVEQVVTVELVGDTLPEGDEHFLFTLSEPTTDGAYPVRIGHQNSASLTVDDEQTPITLHYATKWVSNAGSDVTGDGSQASPWKSLQFAADNVGPGDFVIVQPGRYWGMQVTTDGKPDARITFHAMPGAIVDEPNPENGQDGINLEGADFVTIEGFEVHGMPRAGLRSVNNEGVVLRDNVTDNNGYWGILTGWSDNLLVENNVASRSQREHGIYISNSSDDGMVRNNVVWGNRASGIQFNADGYLPGDGVHSRNVVEGNVIYDNGRGGGAAINLDGFQDGLVQNNLLYDNHATGIVLYVGFAAESSTNNLVRNNTVVMAEDARWAVLLWNGSSGNTLVNNILLNQNPDRGSITIECGSEPARSDFNILEDHFQLDGYGGDFAGWQAFTAGQDTHSIVLEPKEMAAGIDSLFVAPSSGDFHLKENSPALDAGDPAASPSVDIFQHPRPAGAGVDVGAFELGVPGIDVQFEWHDVVAYESIGMVEISVIRQGGTEHALAVEIASAGDSASGGQDYVDVHGWLVFKPGESQRTFRVFVNDDSAIESGETVRLSLRAVGDPSGLIPTDQVGDPTGLIPTDQVGDPVGLMLTDQATLHIVSDDAWRPGKVEFDTPTVSVNEADGTVNVTVHRLGGSSGEISVSYATGAFVPPRQATWIQRHTELLYPNDRDVPALAGEDFVSLQGTLTFADGETSKTISVPLVDDPWFEGGEAFVLKLSDPTHGASLGTRSQLKVHIDSDDFKQAGTFVWTSPAYRFVEGSPTMDVSIQRIGGSNVEAAVQLYDTGAGNGTTTGSAWNGSDYDSVPWEVVFARGETTKTISIPLVDDSVTEPDEVFSIQLYSPTNDATLGEATTTFVTIEDNESTIYFQFPAGQWSFSSVESAAVMPVALVRQGSLATPASARITTGDWGSAIAGVDFAPVDITVTFAPGEATKVVQVPVVNDSIVEGTENFPVYLSQVNGASQGSWSAAANIENDDLAASPGKLQFASASYSGSEAGGFITIVVSRVDGSDGTVSVQYETSDGAAGYSGLTAWAGSDYRSAKGTVTFAPGETTKAFQVPVINDNSVEKNEVFTVTLKNVQGGAALGAVTKAVITILEDDSKIEFGPSSYVVDEQAGMVAIKVVRKGSSAGTATIDLNISGGSAETGIDFIKPVSQTVAFADGEVEKTVYVQIVDDLLAETDEWFYLSLANATNAQLGTNLWGNVKIRSND